MVKTCQRCAERIQKEQDAKKEQDAGRRLTTADEAARPWRLAAVRAEDDSDAAPSSAHGIATCRTCGYPYGRIVKIGARPTSKGQKPQKPHGLGPRLLWCRNVTHSAR
jgi:hypothetical protein